MTEYVYFKRNVGFSVGIRMFQRDNDGMVLTAANPYVNIEKENLKDFLMANKYAIQNGLIIQVEEPSFDFVNENTLTDEEAEEIVKNLFILRKRLPLISSEATLGKLYEAAKRQKRSQKILEIIEDRLADVSPVGMRGSDWGIGEEKDDTGGE